MVLRIILYYGGNYNKHVFLESKRKIPIRHCNDVMTDGDKVIKVTRPYEIYFLSQNYLHAFMDIISSIQYKILSLAMKEKIVDTY